LARQTQEDHDMGLVTAFMAIAGLIGGLALLLMWAGFLERWIDGPVATDTLDSMLSDDEGQIAEPTSAPVGVISETDPVSEADRFAFRSAA
jgi:hypothetical protein